jgi:hypothetical protein
MSWQQRHAGRVLADRVRQVARCFSRASWLQRETSDSILLVGLAALDDERELAALSALPHRRRNDLCSGLDCLDASPRALLYLASMGFEFPPDRRQFLSRDCGGTVSASL